MVLGITLICLGLVLLPAGIYYLIDTFREYRELHPNKRFSAYLLEIVDIFTGGGSLSTWLLGISFLLIVGGLLLVFHNGV
jgi:hypothetical protein